MARASVGVVGGSSTDTAADMPGDEAVKQLGEADDASLEAKRARMQKELLRKKKAERRAQAKQRKQAVEASAPSPPPLPAESELAEPFATTDGHEEVQPSITSVEMETRTMAAEEEEPTVVKKKASKKNKNKNDNTMEAPSRDEPVELLPASGEPVEDHPVSALVTEGITEETDIPANQTDDHPFRHNTTASEAGSHSPTQDHEPTLNEDTSAITADVPEAPAPPPPHSSEPTIAAINHPEKSEPQQTPEPSDAVSPRHSDHEMLIPAPPQQPSSSTTSITSSVNTVSVDDPERLVVIESVEQPPQVEIRAKMTKLSKTKTPPSNDAAAKTIQHAIKKSLVKKTKRTLQKARSFMRHSSKVLAEDTLESPPPAHIRPAIVPPLKLRPRSPPPSSGSSCSSCSSSSPRSSDSGSNGSSYSSGSSGASTLSHRSSSSSSSSSSTSSSPRSSSCSSSSFTGEERSSKARKRGRSKNKRHADSNRTDGSSQDTDRRPRGPSAGMLRLAQPERRPRKYGDVHHFMATRIQARVRGMRGRSVAAKRAEELEREIREEALSEVQDEASVRIQAHVKGFLQRKRMDLDETSRRRHHPHPHRHNKTNMVVPDESGAARDPEDVPVWPDEFNLEPLDGWDELNSVANAQGESVSVAHFLSKGKLRVFCGTWNLHAKKPTDDLRRWIPLNRYHIVAVGTEECVHSIAKSVVFTSKKQWENQLKETLGEEYVVVAAHSLTAIHNVVFVHESVLPYLHNIQSDAVATGLGNQLGNKGGVGIAFSLGTTSLAFVNCHFDAHQHHVAKRNANFHRINQELQLFPAATSSSQTIGKTTSSRFSSSSLASCSSSPPPPTATATAAGSGAAAVAARNGSTHAVRRRTLPISESFDRVFWFGDLNYRINGTRRMIDLLLLHNEHAVLRCNDQLQLEMHKGTVFANFQEGPLHFKPTYKFDKYCNTYDSGPKQRIPSWTDRVLYLSKANRPQDVELLSYRSHMNFQTSDHRPVGAVFQVRFGGVVVNGTAENKRARSGDGGKGGGEGADVVVARADADAFARVLARGYKASQTRSEVCVLQ